MDNELFKQKLSEVAEWRIPKLSKSEIKAATKRRGRGRPTGEEQYQEEHEQAFIELFDGVNPTHHLEITEIKHQPRPCEDCGKMVEGRKKDIKIYRYGTVVGRKEHCLNCDLHKDPYTGEFKYASGTEASAAWTDYARYYTHRALKDK